MTPFHSCVVRLVFCAILHGQLVQTHAAESRRPAFEDPPEVNKDDFQIDHQPSALVELRRHVLSTLLLAMSAYRHPTQRPLDIHRSRRIASSRMLRKIPQAFADEFEKNDLLMVPNVKIHPSKKAKLKINKSLVRGRGSQSQATPFGQQSMDFWKRMALSSDRVRDQFSRRKASHKCRWEVLREQLGREPTLGEVGIACGFDSVSLFKTQLAFLDVCEESLDASVEGHNSSMVEETKNNSRNGVFEDRMTTAEEKACVRTVRRLMAYRSMYDALKENLEREPTPDEWANACGFNASEIFRIDLELCQEAYSRIMKSMMGLIYYLARETRYSDDARFTFEECVQEGFFGMNHALTKYDPAKGSFANYAYLWIKSYMSRARDSSDLMRLPIGVKTDLRKMWRVQHAFEIELNRSPTLAEVAVRMGTSESRVKNLKEAHRNSRLVSLDAPISTKEPDSQTLYDVLSSREQESMDWLSDQVLMERIEKELARLPSQQRIALSMREGLDNNGTNTYLEIAKELGVSVAQARALYSKALKRVCLSFRHDNPEMESMGFGGSSKFAWNTKEHSKPHRHASRGSVDRHALRRDLKASKVPFDSLVIRAKQISQKSEGVRGDGEPPPLYSLEKMIADKPEDVTPSTVLPASRHTLRELKDILAFSDNILRKVQERPPASVASSK